MVFSYGGPLYLPILAGFVRLSASTIEEEDMSWNEPGGGKGPRDPWGGKDQGPPDLDEACLLYTSPSPRD